VLALAGSVNEEDDLENPLLGQEGWNIKRWRVGGGSNGNHPSRDLLIPLPS